MHSTERASDDFNMQSCNIKRGACKLGRYREERRCRGNFNAPQLGYIDVYASLICQARNQASKRASKCLQRTCQQVISRDSENLDRGLLKLTASGSAEATSRVRVPLATNERDCLLNCDRLIKYLSRFPSAVAPLSNQG